MSIMPVRLLPKSSPLRKPKVTEMAFKPLPHERRHLLISAEFSPTIKKYLKTIRHSLYYMARDNDVKIHIRPSGPQKKIIKLGYMNSLLINVKNSQKIAMNM